MELTVAQHIFKHPDFKFVEVAKEILSVTCVPHDLTGHQSERVFDSLVQLWSRGKGYDLSSEVYSALVRTLMKIHDESHVLLQNSIDTYNDLEEVREAGGDLIPALEKYLAAAIAYGDDDIENEAAELRALIREREKISQMAA
ncbi:MULTISPECIES: hypothetical protein [Agrobacterium]|uniref:hypothetical protein n=1 Tax=Agrobacterium TaxID=357 RepID=UPI001572105E|nr:MULTISPECIES: hypothetical protein [Agrobacterium]MCD4659437.1 hypothetical protein [Agrobacterium sp.]NTE54387.1 hypothetical protein [Agrobacterium tumefaciens]NTE70552.1 hypothetical protein [Agrobacterium tumefaciens]